MPADARSLHEADFHARTRLPAREFCALGRARSNGPLDLEHLAREVEDLGKEQRNALRSWVTRIIEHLLRLERSPDEEPRRGWIAEVVELRAEVEARLTPTLRGLLARRLPALWREARQRLLRKTCPFGESAEFEALPDRCPWTLRQVLDPERWPERRG